MERPNLNLAASLAMPALLLLIFVASISAYTAAADQLTVYETLETYDFPVGILTKGATREELYKKGSEECSGMLRECRNSAVTLIGVVTMWIQLLVTWYGLTKPQNVRMHFEVLAKLDGNKVLPERVVQIQPVIAEDGVAQSVLTGNITISKIPIGHHPPNPFHNLIKLMMDANPIWRPSAREIVDNSIFGRI